MADQTAAPQEKSWTLTIDVSGTELFNPGMFDRFPEGVFEMEIQATSREPSKSGKADNVIFDVACVAPAQHKGKRTRVYLNTGDLDDPNSLNRKKWKNLLSTVAKDPAALEKGRVNIGPKLFNGKRVLLHCQPAPEGVKDDQGRRPLDNLTFVTADQAKKLMETLAQKAPAGATATGAQSFDVQGGAASGNGAPRPDAGGALEQAVDL